MNKCDSLYKGYTVKSISKFLNRKSISPLYAP